MTKSLNNPSEMTYDTLMAQNAVTKLCHGLSRSAPMIELARLANVVADILVEPVKNLSTCTKGCSHCCMQSSIMIDEADAALLSQASGRKMDIPDYGESLSLKGIPCVFLDTFANSCTVYEHRPMTCRISESIDDPIKCKTEEFRQMVVAEHLFVEIVRLVGPINRDFYDAARGKLAPADIRQFFRPSTIPRSV